MSQNLRYSIFFLIAFCQPGFGQIEPMPSYEVFEPEYQTYRNEKDLNSFNLIDYLFEDSSNKIWISTGHELKRTNGYQFFNIAQILHTQNPLKGNIIDGQRWNDSTQYLVEQGEYLKRSFALQSFSGYKMIFWDSIPNIMGHLMFYDVLEDDMAYEVWSDSTNSISVKILSSAGVLVKTIDLPFFEGDITGFCMTTQRMWFAIDNRIIISYQIREDGTLLPLTKLQSPGKILKLYSDQFDNIWVTTSDIIFQIRKSNDGYALTPILQKENIHQIFEDSKGNLIMGTISFQNNISAAYLYVRKGRRWINLQPIIDQNENIRLFAGSDFEKEIFLAAKNNLSVLRFSDNPFSIQIINHKKNSQKNQYKGNFLPRGIYKSDSILYVLVSAQGLLIKNLRTGEEELIQFIDPDTHGYLKFDCLKTIEVDAKQRLWFSTCNDLGDGGKNYLIRYNPRTRSSVLIPESYPITAIKMGMSSTLWIASSVNEKTQQVTAFDTDTKKTKSIAGIPQNIGKINDIDLIDQDSFLLAADMGLFRFDASSGSLESIPLLNHSQAKTEIFSISQYDGRYFLGGRDGLFIYTPGRSEVKHYTTNNGLRNNSITAVFREKKNKYWLASFFGISMLNLDENLILNYSNLDGLPDNEFNLYSYFQKDNEFYLGSPKGVIKLDLRDSMVNYFSNYELDHALLYFRANEKPKVLFPVNNHLNIPADISYVKLFPASYASYFIDQFNYKLINSTLNDTIVFSAVKGAILSKIEAGTYHFKLQTYDRYGNRIPGEKEFTVTVNQFFYNTVWFHLLLLLFGNIIIGLIIYGWARARILQKRKSEAMARRLSELELKVLQAQLNPHFIFNTLSAIQYYIQEHDEEHADMYLTSFSRLMRMYLDSSKSSFITLKTEIALLTKYLELEIMVSDGHVQAHYEIDPDLDLENTVIPTMMLQPFVENAIQHGLFHKKQNGNIFLRFRKLSDRRLLCEIEDDGIGRKKADYINEQKPRKPTSRALQIINEKLEVLKVTQGLDIEIEIIDKYHQEIPTGTLVQIKYPIIKASSVSSLVRL